MHRTISCRLPSDVGVAGDYDVRSPQFDMWRRDSSLLTLQETTVPGLKDKGNGNGEGLGTKNHLANGLDVVNNGSKLRRRRFLRKRKKYDFRSSKRAPIERRSGLR